MMTRLDSMVWFSRSFLLSRLGSALAASLLLQVAAWTAEPAPAAAAAEAASPPRSEKPLLLFLPSRQPPKFPDQVAGELKKEGFVLAGHNAFTDLTVDYLRQFHTVVLYYQEMAPKPDDKIRQGLQALRDYVSEGGGLLITKDLYAQRGAEFFKTLLAPLGAELLVEQILDPVNLYDRAQTFAWTDVIARHPVTEGVTGFAYNITRWEPGEPGVIPFKVDANWQVLISGRKEAVTYLPVPAANQYKEVSGPGSFKESPPLLAVREFGKGRIVLWPMLATFTLMDGYSLILENGLTMNSQRGTMKSDGARLTYNVLHWLAEPSQKIEAFGRYTPPPPPPPPPPDLGFQPVNWNKQKEFGPSFSRAWLGLIGARTALSTGEGTPVEFIAAAKKAGYEFLAFCEDINAMPRENWDKLVAACKQATTESFRAIPGVYYLDNAGDAFAVIGDIGYPAASWADPKNSQKKILYNGTIRMAVNPTPPIIMLPLKSNQRPPRYHSSFYGYALQVWENDKLLVEDWDTYVLLQKECLALFPTAVHIVTRPAEVEAARNRGMQAYVRADSLDKLTESIDSLSSARYRWYKPAYPSSGPEICHFFADNWGTSDLAIPGNDRFRLTMLVRSEKGLAEVCLYDYGSLVRRFLPNGAREFKQTVDEYHTGQHAYILTATDTAGGKAVSWDRETTVQECYFVMCSDNMNDMGPGGKLGLDTGLLSLAGTECSVTLKAPAHLWPYTIVNAKLPDGTKIENPSYRAALKSIAIVSRFGYIMDYPLGYSWDGPGSPGAVYPAPLKTIPWYGGSYRTYTFARRPPGPTLEVRDYTVEIKEDMELTSTPGVQLVSSSNWKLAEGVLDHIVHFEPDGGAVVEAPDQAMGSQNLSVSAKPGEYIAVFPMCTAIFPLDDQPLYGNWLRFAKDPYGTVLQVGCGQAGEKLTKGTVIHRRLALVSLPFAAQGEYSWMPEYKRCWNSNLVAEEIRTKLGLAGPPAYKIAPSVGKVTDTKVVLSLEADGGGFRATIPQCHLPVPLPVFIRGLNPHWSAGVWYKGKNVLLQTEWPPGYHQGDPAHRRYVQNREKTDEIIRLGFFDGNVGFLQLDLESGDRDLFIGNLVVCDRPELFLTFYRDLKSGKATVDVHNPGDQAVTTVVRPGKGFDLLGDFSKTVMVPAGATVVLEM